jgi:thiol reductant ABC exporter CydD subunit
MKPLDPRLLRYARATRWFLFASVALGVASAGLLIAQATLLASAIAGVVTRGAPVRDELIGLAFVVAGQAAVAWGRDAVAHRTSASVISTLRRALLLRAVEMGGVRTGELATLASRGIDALEGYFARYLPQLVLAVIVPALVGARLLAADWLTAVVLAVTVPLIPLFMALVGWYTQGRTRRQWRAMAGLSGHFLDVVAGLPTLVVFGRAKAQVATVRRVTEQYRRTTMGVLRAAFLSSLVLELLATISVALVAVSVGLRLVEGSLTFQTALLVLILAPEVYLPLRLLGAQFHASTEGLEAANSVFEVLEEQVPMAGVRTEIPVGPLVLDAVTVGYPGRPVLGPFSVAAAPGRVTALAGPSGAGKSTLLAAVLGFLSPTSGRVTIGGVNVADLEPTAWRAQLAWVPQRPTLFAGTIAENIRVGLSGASDAAVASAASDAALSGHDLDTLLGDDGAGLSAGERQRVGLARAFLRDAPIVLLDEPTANLDGTSEERVLTALRRLVAGRTVLLVAHRPALFALADDVVEVGGERVPG